MPVIAFYEESLTVIFTSAAITHLPLTRNRMFAVMQPYMSTMVRGHFTNWLLFCCPDQSSYWSSSHHNRRATRDAVFCSFWDFRFMCWIYSASKLNKSCWRGRVQNWSLYLWREYLSVHWAEFSTAGLVENHYLMVSSVHMVLCTKYLVSLSKRICLALASTLYCWYPLPWILNHVICMNHKDCCWVQCLSNTTPPAWIFPEF